MGYLTQDVLKSAMSDAIDPRTINTMLAWIMLNASSENERFNDFNSRVVIGIFNLTESRSSDTSNCTLLKNHPDYRERERQWKDSSSENRLSFVLLLFGRFRFQFDTISIQDFNQLLNKYTALTISGILPAKNLDCSAKNPSLVLNPNLQDKVLDASLAKKWSEKGAGPFNQFKEIKSKNNNTIGDIEKTTTNVGGLNLILVGAPGTGKTTAVKNETKGCDIYRTTFHEEMTHGEFFGQLRPDVNDSQSIIFKFEPGPFLEAYSRAWEMNSEDRRVYLIIEEMSRGKAAQIFGRIFTLLDRNIDTGESEYYETVNTTALKSYLKSKNFESKLSKSGCSLIEKLVLPSNLYLVATMNQQDQSTQSLDSAFLRRWEKKVFDVDLNQVEWTVMSSEGKIDGKIIIGYINEKIVDPESSIYNPLEMGQYYIHTKHLDLQDERSKRETIWNRIYSHLSSLGLRDSEILEKFFEKRDGNKLSDIRKKWIDEGINVFTNRYADEVKNVS